MNEERDRGQIINDRKKASREWLKNNFYPEWEEAWKHYKVYCDPQTDDEGKVDEERSAIGSPLTWSAVHRLKARVTAQTPNMGFHAQDRGVSDMIGRTLMYQWDRARIQRIQKKHILQAAICGWSPRAWHWAVDEHQARKRVDIQQAAADPQTLKLIADTYKQPAQYMQPGNPLTGRVLTRLLGKHGRGNLLPVEYIYKAYEGPKCEFTFVGNCFPQPQFQSIQSSDWFIINRRRNSSWMEEVVKAYPELRDGFEEVLKEHPDGMKPRYQGDNEDEELFRNLLTAINKTAGLENQHATEAETGHWIITEHHVPGPSPYLEYACGEIYIGRIEYPYELAGKIAFTECILIDDLLSGVGDSTARVMRGLHKMHERQMNSRLDLVYNLVRPLLGTNNRRLIDNPNEIRRGAGFRLVYMRGPGDIWTQSEQSATAAAAASLQDESSILRLYQMLTGESNMSLMANVDPQQNKTATGAKISANIMDVLTKDFQDTLLQSSLVEDAEMMYLLNRSELSEPVQFEASRYNRLNSYEKDAWKEKWVQIEPLHFQVDGEITVEAGSMLADDDESRAMVARELFQAALQFPMAINLEKARDEFLISHGKRHELNQWIPEPPEPRSPDMKASTSFTVRYEELNEPERRQLMAKHGIDSNPQPEGQAPPGGPPPPMPPQGGAA
ncbi:MAG TPA: hypothetical protein VFI02_16555 [Armatimonadota bacterium]|nr:hypothetical protein [Armatimonadota bacterium]